MLIGYFNDTYWLWSAEGDLDDVLAGKEPPEMEIKLIKCASWPAVVELWSEPAEGKLPWAINPKIIERIKTRANTINEIPA